jgi:hypothetical protein
MREMWLIRRPNQVVVCSSQQSARASLSRVIMKRLSCVRAMQVSKNERLVACGAGLPTTRDIIVGNPGALIIVCGAYPTFGAYLTAPMQPP